jgi:NAD dependent epimerase/dehydratase family
METVLVTGGVGFIGSHTCKALASHGFLPVAFDDLSRGHAEFVRWGPLVNGDILDLAALDAAFERHRPGAVIHFAALAYVGESMSRPLVYYRINVAGLVNVLEAMLRHGTSTIVFSSSCATYGIPSELPTPGQMRDGLRPTRRARRLLPPIKMQNLGARPRVPKRRYSDRPMPPEFGRCGELFHTPSGTAFADIPVNDPRETGPYASKRFRSWGCGGASTRRPGRPRAPRPSARRLISWKRRRNSMA